jgi:Concanavalin A-like lectin/glucanases superfamily
MLGLTRRRGALVAVSAVALLPMVGPTTPATAAGEATISADAASTYQTNGVVWALAYAKGVVYAGGTFTRVRPPGSPAGTNETVRTNFAAFDAATGALLPCAPAFSGSGSSVRAITASADGNTVYVGGLFSTAGGIGVQNLAALDTASCTVNSSFHPAVNGWVRTIAVNSTGSTIYFAGEFPSVAGQPRGQNAAVTTAGALLPWAPNAVPPAGNSLYTSMRALTISADDSRVVLGGDFEELNGQPVHRLAIVDATSGATLNTFGGFIDPTSTVKALAHDDQNFYLGAEGTGGGVFDGRAAFNIYTGQLVWRDDCLGATLTVLPYNGVLYSGSHAHDCSATEGGYPDGARHHLLAQSIADKTLLPWFPNTNGGIGEALGPRALAMANGILWVGGEFTAVNGVAQQGLTRFTPKPDNNTPSPPTPTAASYAAGKVNVRWRTSVDNDDGTLTYQLYRDGGSTPIATVSGESRFWDRPQLSFVDTVTPGTFHTYRLTVSDANSTSALGGTVGVTAATTTSAYAQRVLADNPSTYWRLDDASGTYAADTSAGNNAGVFSGGLTYRQPGGVPGDSNTALVFDGTNGRVANWHLTTGPTTFSTELWFKTTTTSGGKLIGFGNASSGNAGSGFSWNYDRHIYMTNSGRLIFGNWVGFAATAASTTSYNDGAWHYVVATSGPAGMHLYVDGDEVGFNPNTNAQAYKGSWRLGNDNLNGWPNQPSSSAFAGSIDDVAIYDAQLTPEQVVTHFTGSPPPPPTSYPQAVTQSHPSLYWRLGEAAGATTADDAVNHVDGSYGASGVTLGAPGVVPNDSDTAATLAGTNTGVVSTSPFTNPSVYSEELWFKTTTTSGGKLIGFGNNPSGDSWNYDRHVYMTNNGQLIYGVWTGSATIITSPSSYNEGNWHYLVTTMGSGGMAMYVDGVQVGTNPNNVAQGYDGYWKVGGDNLNGWPSQPASSSFAGTIDEVAIYPTALTPATVAAHYQQVTG